MGDCVESLAEVKVDNIHGSPFVYPASHVIVESYQILPIAAVNIYCKIMSLLF